MGSPTPEGSSALLRAATRLRKEGRATEALAQLRQALQMGAFTAEDVASAGRVIGAEIAQWSGEKRPLRVLLLGQCTLSWLKYALTAIAWRHGQALLVTDGGYDNVMQELMGSLHGDGTGSEKPDIVALVPWSGRRLDGGVRATGAQVADEVTFWEGAQKLISERFGARIVQVGYDTMTPGAGGYHLSGGSLGHIGRLRQVNTELRERLAPGGYFVDLEQVAGAMGREQFYSARRHHWTKQPFSEVGIVRLAEHLYAGVRATVTGPKKVLVLDLDNTVWGGVVGETGPHGITLGDGPDGEAFQAFQAYARDLTTRGVLLAAASKNNAADAREPFNVNREMLLTLDHFAAFEASWEPKSVTIARIAKTLNLGLDSFVFFDDNPVERAEVRHELPDVEVVEVPSDPADYVAALEAGLWFESTDLTDVDLQRVSQYAVERTRRELEQSADSMEAYLQSLNLRAEVEPVTDADASRVVQLLAKTNQFNVTTRRHTHDNLTELIAGPRSIALTMRAFDRFGDYGLVAVMLGVASDTDAAQIRVDTWLMSCRVIGRTFEQYMFGEFVKRSITLGYTRLLGEYIPTQKNSLVEKLFTDVGCERLEPENPGESSLWYALDLLTAELPATSVLAAEKVAANHGS